MPSDAFAEAGQSVIDAAGRLEDAGDGRATPLSLRFLERYREIFRKLFAEEHGLIVKHSWVGLVLGSLSTLALYAAYAFITRTLACAITLGDMTMYLLVFKQGQKLYNLPV